MPERDCAGCKRQTEWGCDAYYDPDAGEWKNKAVIPLEFDGEEVWRCPRRPILNDPEYWQRLMLFYGLYKKGHMPDAGGVTDQSYRAITLFRILENIVTECEDETAERDKRRASRGAQSPA